MMAQHTSTIQTATDLILVAGVTALLLPLLLALLVKPQSDCNEQ